MEDNQKQDLEFEQIIKYRPEFEKKYQSDKRNLLENFNRVSVAMMHFWMLIGELEINVRKVLSLLLYSYRYKKSLASASKFLAEKTFEELLSCWLSIYMLGVQESGRVPSGSMHNNEMLLIEIFKFFKETRNEYAQQRYKTGM